MKAALNRGTHLAIILIIFVHLVTPKCYDTVEGNKASLVCEDLDENLGNRKRTDFVQLIIDGDNTRWTELTAANFSMFKRLEVLRIASTRVSRVHRNAFSQLKHLEQLDLSRNRIITFEPGTFRGLNLKQLVLTGNRGLRLHQDTFMQSNINSVILTGCEIDKILFSTFEKANIRHLILSDNRISEVSDEFASFLRRSDRHPTWGHIDLSSNPLRCTCNMYWLVKLILDQEKDIAMQRLQRRDQSSTILSSSFKPMHNLVLECASPKRFAGRRLPLSQESLCPQPQITDIFVEMIDSLFTKAKLTCKAQGQDIPSITWIDQEMERTTRMPHSSNGLRIDGSTMYENQLSLNVSLDSNRMNRFTCIAFNTPQGSTNGETSRSHKIELKFRTPILIKNSTDIKYDVTPKIDSFVTDVYEDKYSYSTFFMKRYTLLELIGAIFGTFFMTIVMLYCLSRFVHVCCTKRKKMIGESMDKSYLKGSEVKCTIENNSDVFFSQNDSVITSPTNAISAPSGTVSSSLGNNPPNWPQPEYYYSNSTGNEYDIPRNWEHSNNSPSLQSQCPQVFQTNDNRGSLSTTLLRKNVQNNNLYLQSVPQLPSTTETNNHLIMLPNNLTTNPQFSANSSTTNSSNYFSSINPSIIPISYLTAQQQLKNLNDNQLLLQQRVAANVFLSQQNGQLDTSMNTMQNRPLQQTRLKNVNFNEERNTFSDNFSISKFNPTVNGTTNTISPSVAAQLKNEKLSNNSN